MWARWASTTACRRSLGNWELNGALAVNSPLGYGEQLYGAASTGYDLGKVFDATTPMQLLGAGAVLPIGVDGLQDQPRIHQLGDQARSLSGGAA